MIDALLHPPASLREYLADAVRMAGVVSVVVALFLLGPVETALFLLVLLGLLVSRALAVFPGFDAAYGVVLLTAAWSSVADLYARIPWWDLAVHCAATGTLAVIAYFLLVQFGAVPAVRRPHRASRSLPVVVPLLVLALGLGMGVLWEIGEWWGHTYVDASINVGYADTMTDLAAGGLGALAAGLCLGMAVRRSGALLLAPLPHRAGR
ncbi:hypothetical protein [Arthrobacter sp. zg-Y877]|uniref:hypothetical protein n=1 Tax=Arthrobacter sp. zg-Y877 TaxID=3049074 RepID=UPI0025A3B1AE|nr:hypothetical protein [Arthrobacter sp. zg-Y877]MDM7990100.1 hypothetical protein [Arthrobacter sp. zg-Y877]